MPNGRRKVPYSGKKKKKQLILKRQSNKTNPKFLRVNLSDNSDQDGEKCTQSLNKQPGVPSASKNSDRNRYNLQFHVESKRELMKLMKTAKEPLRKITDDLEIDEKYFLGYDFPKRPEWHYGISKDELIRNENRYFKEYIDEIMRKHSETTANTSVFELNLETWRQLWRVIEMSDILLVVVDSRYPTLLFPPSIFEYVEKTLNKNVILLLNKVDLIAPESALAWKKYFINKYPGIHVILFASYKRKCTSNRKNNRKNKNEIPIDSIRKIFEICKEIVNGLSVNINLNSWEQKILEDSEYDEAEKLEIQNESFVSISTEFDAETNTKFKNNILTIGSIGFPNVGKSTVINSLKGRKVVSVSRTPGHTKHFQTIFLTENVKLCDSPGLVFPSSVPKYMQVLIGSFPIAQLREPFRSLVFVGEHIDLPRAIGVSLPPDHKEWSAMAICEAWCLKRGFFTAKASRLDCYRAANNLLRLILEGKILIQTFPPCYKSILENLIEDDELNEIRLLQGLEKSSDLDDAVEELSTDDNESTDDHNDFCGVEENRRVENFFSLLDSD